MGGIIEMQIKLPITFQKREKWILAGCSQLDIFSQGKTKEQALENLSEALRLFIFSCLQNNTLTQVLEECGFRLTNDPVTDHEKDIADKENYINIPIPFTLAVDGGSDCHA